MTLSVGQLHSATQLLNWVSRNHLSKSDMNSFTHVLVCPATDVLNLSTRCGWIDIDLDGSLKLSKRGMELHKTEDYQLRLRLQMQDVISREQPSWSNLFAKGRQETVHFVDIDIRQCLDEAGLLTTPPTNEVIEWWDDMAALVRGVKSSILSQTGREGERLSLAYEQTRTGKQPIWQSIESNLSGYDVLSVLSNSDNTPLQIEVKTSHNTWHYADFYLTSNEWESAVLARNYLFHLWSLESKPKLAIISVEEMRKHVPTNEGKGEWVSAKIPFCEFTHNLI